MSQRELWLWLAVILLANQLLLPPIDPNVVAPAEGVPATVVQALLTRSVFYYLGWYVVFSLILASGSERPASALDLAIAFPIVLTNVVPGFGTNWPATTVTAFLIYGRGRDDANLKAAATVLLALCINGYWGAKLFDIFAFYVVRLDAALVGLALAATQPGMEWSGAVVGRPNAHSLLVLGPCSSFHNISLGLLAWISLLKLVRPRWMSGDWVIPVIISAVVVLLNVCRLYLMALGPEQYTYWHRGPGEEIFAWITTVSVLALSLWGALRRGAKA